MSASSLSSNLSKFNPESEVAVSLEHVSLPATNRNPPRHLTVFQEGYLLCGTKQRALPLLTSKSESELVYTGATSGAAQVLVAWAAKLSGKKATLFVPVYSNQPEHPMLKRAKELGAQVIYKRNAKLFELRQAATTHYKQRKAYLVPFGLEEAPFISELIKNLKRNIPDELRYTTKTIWLVYGSGVLLKVLKDVFPRAQFSAVVVGKKPKTTQLDRTHFYFSEEQFWDPAKVLPPYQSIPEYDAKVWRFVVDHAKDGDFIWNVAACELPETTEESVPEDDNYLYIFAKGVEGTGGHSGHASAFVFPDGQIRMIHGFIPDSKSNPELYAIASSLAHLTFLLDSVPSFRDLKVILVSPYQIPKLSTISNTNPVFKMVECVENHLSNLTPRISITVNPGDDQDETTRAWKIRVHQLAQAGSVAKKNMIFEDY